MSFLHNLTAQLFSGQHTGTWGDQGNGTYKNPILEANYPDNDVIRAGDTFYMMSSTNHFAPGMIILKSKDLVNWEFSNAILPAPITFDEDFMVGRNDAMVSRATWAGSFGYNGKDYFAYWCFNKPTAANGNNADMAYKILYVKAKSPAGPWTRPRELTWPDGSSIHSTDPGVMWDRETKRAWIATNEGKIHEMSWDGERVLRDKKDGIVVTTTMSGEAAKLYKFDGIYYYMNAHWRVHKGVNQRMATFHRAPKMEGPWEGRLAMENGNGTDRSPSQGSLLRLDNGSFWFIHQLARGEDAERYNGRPQMLEPVKWQDGWPLIGVDTDGNGIGEVVWQHAKPINGFPITAPATDDNFSSPELGLQWYWRFNPRMDRWSLAERPGYLRLKSTVPVARQGGLKQLPNILNQRVMGRHNNMMTAEFDLGGMANGQEAGFHLSSGSGLSAIGVRKDDAGKMTLFFRSNANEESPDFEMIGDPVKQSTIWMRAKIDNGLASFFYGFDGKNFMPLGKSVRLLFHGFTSTSVGFYSMNREEKGFLDVAWFRYDYDGPKGK